MKAKQLILLVFFIGLSALVFYFANSKTSNLSDPKFIPLEEQGIVGFYDWSLIGPSGVQKNMIIDKDNVIFIHLWDINDVNVLEELETLEVIYDEYKTKAQFYFVTKNSQVEVRDFIQKHKFNFPVYFSLSKIPKPMVFTSSPSTYLLNKKGRIVIDSKVATNWDNDALREIMDNLIK